MNCILLDLDVPVGPTEVGHQLIVISRDVDYMRPFAGFAQNLLDHVVVLLGPVNSATQRPNIDQVTHDIERIEIVLAQEIQQRSGIAAARTKVRIRNPRRAITSRRLEVLSGLAKCESLLRRKNLL